MIRNGTGFPVTATLRALLPSFCWQTAFEVVTMMEAAHLDVNEHTVKVQLSRLARAREIFCEYRPAIVQGGYRAFYRNRALA
jgi:hypothetical protein